MKIKNEIDHIIINHYDDSDSNYAESDWYIESDDYEDSQVAKLDMIVQILYCTATSTNRMTFLHINEQ